MKTKLTGLAVLTALVAASQSVGATPAIVGKGIAVGTMQATTVRAKTGSMVLERIKIAPGGSFGWHSHPAPVAVVVTAGTLTVLDPAVNNCTPFTVGKGKSFIEPANHVHLARNDGRTPVRVYAMYLGVPKGVAPNAPASAPATCG